MAVDLTLSDTTVYNNLSVAISGYTAVEDATPIDPAKSAGGVGQLSFSVIEDPDANGTVTLIDATVNMSDGEKGTTVGVISSIDMDSGIANISADSRLTALLNTRTAAPMATTMEQTFRYYLSLANITSGIVFELPEDVTYRYGVNAIVPTPGWRGVVFDYLRDFAVVCGAEISLVSDNVVFRPLRTRVAEVKRDSAQRLTTAKGSLAQFVEVAYYQNRFVVNGQAYPPGGAWKSDVPVYQVDAGEELEVEIELPASLTSITQPVCVPYVARYAQGSVYSVIGNDGLAIVPQQWLDGGGSVTVRIGEDTSTVVITIKGSIKTDLAPYRIAVGAGVSDAYSSLRLQATGTYTDKQILRIPTGVSAEETPQEVGVTVDNPYISTVDDAYTLGIRTAMNYSGFEQSFSATTVGINRAGVSGSTAYPTFDDFNTGLDGRVTVWNGKTFNDFNAEWASSTFATISDYYLNLVLAEFSNQAFGNVSGARVRYRDSWYRIDSANITPNSVSYNASADTLFSDFSTAWLLTPYEGMSGGPRPAKTTDYTYAEFNAMMGNRTFNNFAASPLWRTYAGLSTA